MVDDPSAFPDIPTGSILLLLAIGFAVAAVGHLYRSRAVVALGIVLIVVAVAVLPLVAFLAGEGF